MLDISTKKRAGRNIQWIKYNPTIDKVPSALSYTHSNFYLVISQYGKIKTFSVFENYGFSYFYWFFLPTCRVDIIY